MTHRPVHRPAGLVLGSPATHRTTDRPHGRTPTPTIADSFADLLAQLNPRRRRGLIARLSRGYYEGWRPNRAEIAALVAEERRRTV